MKNPEVSRAVEFRSRRALVSPSEVRHDSRCVIDEESKDAEVDQECPGVTLKSPSTMMWCLSFRLAKMVGVRLARSSCWAREQW